MGGGTNIRCFRCFHFNRKEHEIQREEDESVVLSFLILTLFSSSFASLLSFSPFLLRITAKGQEKGGTTIRFLQRIGQTLWRD